MNPIQLQSQIRKNRVLVDSTNVQNDDGSIIVTENYTSTITWQEVRTINPTAISDQIANLQAKQAEATQILQSVNAQPLQATKS